MTQLPEQFRDGFYLPSDLLAQRPEKTVKVTARETVETPDMTDMAPEEKLIAATLIATLLPEQPRREIVGLWLWLDFDGKPSDESREIMKTAGFRWSPKRVRWYFAAKPSGRARGWSMDQVRERHGSLKLD